MFDFQSDLVFPVHAVPQPGPLPANAERLSLRTTDGSRLEGIFMGSEQRQAARTLVLGFGGNAWNGQDVAEYLHDLFPEQDVVAFHYRGYRPSTGSPSARALIADAPLVYDAAVKRSLPERVIVIGFRIGTGVAAQLVQQRKVAGLILVTPFDSLKAVAQSMIPWFPIGSFFTHQIDAVEALERTQVPVAIIAAERDEIVPRERTEALRRKIPNLVFDRTIRRAGHNGIYARSDFHDAMHQAFACLDA